jgi:hypothetical protein
MLCRTAAVVGAPDRIEIVESLSTLESWKPGGLLALLTYHISHPFLDDESAQKGLAIKILRTAAFLFEESLSVPGSGHKSKIAMRPDPSILRFVIVDLLVGTEQGLFEPVLRLFLLYGARPWFWLKASAFDDALFFQIGSNKRQL